MKNYLAHHEKVKTFLFRETEREFENEFVKEILISERKRVMILGSLLVSLLVLSVVVFALYGDDIIEFYPKSKKYMFVPVLICSGAILYEIGVFIALTLSIRHKRAFPEPARYLNAFIETSLPTLLLYFPAKWADVSDVMIGPGAYAYFFFIMLSTLRLNFRLCFFTGIVAALEYGGLAYYFRSQIASNSEEFLSMSLQAYYIKSFLLFLGGLIAGIVSKQIKDSFMNSLQTIEERNHLMDMFGQHVSPAVVDRLLNQKVEIESEVRHVCVMFLDIRNFTSFSEKRSPEEVVNYLNKLFEFMIESINKNNGIINKFLGDGFMAIFGAPISDGLDSHNAVNASVDILSKIQEMNNSGAIPETRIGIGLHAGEAVTGNVGSNIRKEYTIIGDVVNLASRIEQLNKQFSSQFLVSDIVWDQIGKKFPGAKALEPVQVKGRLDFVQIYQLA